MGVQLSKYVGLAYNMPLFFNHSFSTNVALGWHGTSANRLMPRFCHNRRLSKIFMLYIQVVKFIFEIAKVERDGTRMECLLFQLIFSSQCQPSNFFVFVKMNLPPVIAFEAELQRVPLEARDAFETID
ncbi:hypothetical protein PsorP6_010170 [Peronosclerospora sorghi]|uniref:Uncharacterized protein n=1 Tax=Peronosclerospora sorghi TaxID=230839 RepID=A0ACC0VU04_9STRA|nr:hypothetical protein PsorP6_010170 [Peronosclerospora sorghi]